MNSKKPFWNCSFTCMSSRTEMVTGWLFTSFVTASDLSGAVAVAFRHGHAGHQRILLVRTHDAEHVAFYPQQKVIEDVQ